MRSTQQAIATTFKVLGVVFGILTLLVGLSNTEGVVHKVEAVLVAVLVAAILFFFGFVLQSLDEQLDQGEGIARELAAIHKALAHLGDPPAAPAQPSQGRTVAPGTLYVCPKCGGRTPAEHFGPEWTRMCPLCNKTSFHTQWTIG